MELSADFVVNSPAKGDEWINGQTWGVSWTKGLQDDVDAFDIELSRMSTDGIIYVASAGASRSLSLCSFHLLTFCVPHFSFVTTHRHSHDSTLPLYSFDPLVPALLGSFNLDITGLPAADDYYLLFINSTHGVLYGNSYAFSIVDSATNASTPKLDSSKPTVSVSGGPNPTAVFATTFPASASSALGTYVIGTGVVGMVGLAVVSMLGGAWAVL